ncbi:DUF3493 domain-containing protein [Leptolyngbyaceae cyanobacterium CCMR0082]|uniref:DUF3493 domain-containing protein n=2 Tax=Adonisia turfae TaxID=2950184 RepID=A0A6M0SK22_9CYAN|nr:DUF3493 domain-containing protein [Adonisia turfae]MDV3349205.1 DUF3493 domain-containing protein [Leptothoe sp. LEGE 181152]NEZ58218.1 DUF3493 domain-containing protein [Adonisia turfae CCMR0081]NEZ67852.1 DUF3493 domain-containing protein [Adonisia turfae CCMR0082]
MAKKSGSSDRTPTKPPGMSQERFERLVQETQSPFKGMRKVIYGAVGASGLLGAFVFLTQLMAGKDVETALPNLAVQMGVIGIVVFLFWLEGRGKRDA